MSGKKDLTRGLVVPTSTALVPTSTNLVGKDPKQSKKTTKINRQRHDSNIRKRVLDGMKLWQHYHDEARENRGDNEPIKFEDVFKDRKAWGNALWLPEAYKDVVNNVSPMFGQFADKVRTELLSTVGKYGPIEAMNAVIQKWNEYNEQKIKEADLNKALKVKVPTRSLDVIMGKDQKNLKRKLDQDTLRYVRGKTSDLLAEKKTSLALQDLEIKNIFQRSSPQNSLIAKLPQPMQIEAPAVSSSSSSSSSSSGGELKAAVARRSNEVRGVYPSNQINPQTQQPWVSPAPNIPNPAPAISLNPPSGTRVEVAIANNQKMVPFNNSTPSGQLTVSENKQIPMEIATTSTALTTINQERNVEEVRKEENKLVKVQHTEKHVAEYSPPPNQTDAEFNRQVARPSTNSTALGNNSGYLLGPQKQEVYNQALVNRHHEDVATIFPIPREKKRSSPYSRRPGERRDKSPDARPDGEVTFQPQSLSSASNVLQPGSNSFAVIPTTGARASSDQVTGPINKIFDNPENKKSSEEVKRMLGTKAYENKYNDNIKSQETATSGFEFGNNFGEGKQSEFGTGHNGPPSLEKDTDMDTDEAMHDLNAFWNITRVGEEEKEEKQEHPAMTPQQIGSNAPPPQQLASTSTMPQDYVKISQSQNKQAPSQEVTDPTLRYELLEGGANEVYKLNSNPRAKEITNLTWQSFNNYDWDSNAEADNYLNIMRILNDAARFSGELNGENEEQHLNELSRKSEIGLYDKGDSLATDEISETRQTVSEYGILGEESMAVFQPTVWPEGTIQTSDITTDWAIKTGDEVDSEFHDANLPCSALFNKYLKDFSLADGSNITKRGKSGFSNFWWKQGMQQDQYIGLTVD